MYFMGGVKGERARERDFLSVVMSLLPRANNPGFHAVSHYYFLLFLSLFGDFQLSCTTC